ncbi:MAG: beta-propeller domain-containing protein [Clostridiales bacterium]|jgi:uncharacterized secreted protein with C-terminal beta-propeller domain|nr:beta-propeller domain-containing protein [Clostridiales bacterium]
MKKGKKLFLVTLIVSAVLCLGAAPPEIAKYSKEIVFRVGSSKALLQGKAEFIDEENLNVIPFTQNDTVYVPLRFVSDALGGKVTYNAGKVPLTLSLSLGGKKFGFTAGSTSVSIDARRTVMEKPAIIENGRAFVPLSFVDEITGKEVSYESGLIFISDKAQIKPSETEIGKIKTELSVLPSFETEEALNEYFSEMDEKVNRFYEYAADGIMVMEEAEAFADSAPRAEMAASAAAAEPAMDSAMNGAAAAKGAGSAEYSEVNIQVAGVDEADIIRTNGKYIYALNSNSVIIINAYPADKMKEVSRYNFHRDIMPLEMYADGDKLTIISNEYSRRGDYLTNITVLDISDIESPKVAREDAIEGSYLSSRKIGDDVYVVTNSYYYKGKKPVFFAGDTEKDIAATDIYCFPGSLSYGCLTVAGISLDKMNEEPYINMYMGAGSTIYVSQKYMYIAEPSYNYDYNEAIDAMPWLGRSFADNNMSTLIHKLSLYDGKASYIGSGAVNGSILNQFSMDEYNSNFRIATNDGRANNVYILDSQLKPKAEIEDIAPGERIYSTRFLGNRGYMVTFRTTDPLFVIDMNPENPQILGALKIPGYSDYLHPYDENTIIGFGKDTAESYGVAYYLGMKMAIFDISDVSNPKQKFVETIGDRGTESDLLYNHKALLFDKEKNLLAFPVTVYETEEDAEVYEYGAFKFQGAYVYDISLDSGFEKRGEITHMTEEEYKKSGMMWYDYGYSGGDGSPAIKRIIYIGDSLYTLSGRYLMAHDMYDVSYISEVELNE